MTMFRQWRVVLAGLMVVAMFSGCAKKKGGSGSAGIDGNIGGIPGSEIGIGDLDGMGGERFDDGSPVEGLFQPVYFEYDSSRVNASERSKIEQVAEHLRRNGSQRVIVEGHCDERGSNEYNLALGERRALAVRAYLIGLQINADRIQTKSFGEERPAAMGHGEDSWRLNRRCEFLVVE